MAAPTPESVARAAENRLRPPGRQGGPTKNLNLAGLVLLGVLPVGVVYLLIRLDGLYRIAGKFLLVFAIGPVAGIIFHFGRQHARRLRESRKAPPPPERPR